MTDIWDDDEFDNMAISAEDMQKINEQNDNEFHQTIETLNNRQKQLNADSAKETSETEQPVQQVSEPEPKAEAETISIPESKPEPETISIPESKPEPETTPVQSSFSISSLLNDDDDDDENEKEKPTEIDTPISSKSFILDDDDDDEDDFSSFSSQMVKMSMPVSAPVPAPEPVSVPSSPAMNPNAASITKTPETANNDFLQDSSKGEEEQTTSNSAISQLFGTIVMGDPDKMTMHPAEWAVYSRIPQKTGNSQSPEWLAQMQQAMPSSKMFQEMLNLWIDENQNLLEIFKLPSLREAKKWSVPDILQDAQLRNVLSQSAGAFWQETLSQAKGNESVSWLQKVWLGKLVQYAVNYFMICMK